MLVGSLLVGFRGGLETLFVGCFTYIADITLPEKRAFRIVIAEFCMFLSVILTPVGIGVWIQKSGYLWPFVCVLCGQSIAMLYGIFLVPETVIPDPNAKFFTFTHLRDTAALYIKDNATKRRWKLDFLMVAFFVFALVSLPSMSGLSSVMQ